MSDEVEIFKKTLDKAQTALEACAVMLNAAAVTIKEQADQINALTVENLNLKEKLEGRCLRN